MLLILSDVHGRFEVVNEQIADAEDRVGSALAGVVVLGDFGLIEPHLRRFFRKRSERFARPLAFVDGNHEDFDHFEALVDGYADVFTHWPRGSVQDLDGHRFLCLGGAAYMDAFMTPERAVVRVRDIERCLSHPAGAVSAVLSHDCPAGIGVENTPGFEHYGPPGFPGGDRLVEHFHPGLWLFGHHHRWFETALGGTRYVGLPQSWDGYVLLDRDGTLSRVQNCLRVTTPSTQGLLGRLFGRG